MYRQTSSEKSILPVTYPMITSYMSYAPALSILSYYQQCAPWIYNNFINLYGEYFGSGYSTLRFHPQFMVAPNNPFLDYYIAPRDIMLYNYHNVEEYFTNAIFNGYYICTDYDEYYVEYTNNYKKKHKKHQIFIYGYDKQKGLFYIAEFFNNQCYSFEKVTFEQMENAVIQPDKSSQIAIWISMFEYKSAEYHFDYSLFLASIKDYIRSESNTINWEDNQFCKTHNIIFGMDNYEYIMKYILRLRDEENVYEDIRSFHVLYDHKTLMVSRLKFIQSNAIMKYDDHIIESFNTIKNSCDINRSLFIKYQLTKKSGLLTKIVDNIKYIQMYEKEAMNKLLHY